ncbi:MAG: DsrE family protein [Cyanobacteria bacterium P01_H01_bin.121]
MTWLITPAIGSVVGWGMGAVLSVSPVLAQAKIPPADSLSQTLKDQAQSLLVNLTTDDTWAATMAITMATKAAQQSDQPVILFLSVRGVYIADRERLPATEGNSDLNIHEKLQALVAAGGQVIACPNCAGEAGLTQADLVDGVILGEPGVVLPLLLDANTATLSF